MDVYYGLGMGITTTKITSTVIVGVILIILGLVIVYGLLGAINDGRSLEFASGYDLSSDAFNTILLYSGMGSLIAGSEAILLELNQ